jgi:hypothetical protein
MDTDTPDTVADQCAHCVREQQARLKEVSGMRKLAEILKLNMPIPRDILSLMPKDDTKQAEIVVKIMSLEKRE